MQKGPLISVVLPTYNSASTLEKCLDSIVEQTYRSIEVIIVDSYSRDDTVEIANKFPSTVFRTRQLRSAARNLGAKNAKGEYLIFIDADMQLTPNVIQQCVKKSLDEKIDAIMIHEIRVATGYWGKCRAIERCMYVGNPLIESARFFSKKAFESVGGFDEDLEAGEDWDLHARVEQSGFKIGSIESYVKHNEGYVTLRAICLKRYYYGKTLSKYIEKHPDKAMVQFMPIRLDFIRNWKVLLKDPLHGTGMVLMKSIEYTTTAIAMISK
jgi:glycosyltransferase involved in cell wall biosynthesis